MDISKSKLGLDPSEHRDSTSPEDATAEITLLAHEHEERVGRFERMENEARAEGRKVDLDARATWYRTEYRHLAGCLEESLPYLVPEGEARDALQFYIEVRRTLAAL